MPDDLDEVRVEKRLASRRQPDVTLCSSGETRVAIEVLVTHLVDAEKAVAFGDLRWCELAAEDVLAEPLRWKPLRDELRPWPCPTCARAKADRDRRARVAAERAAAEAARGPEVLPRASTPRRGRLLVDATRCDREHWKAMPGCPGCDAELAEIREDLATLAKPSPFDAEMIFHARHWLPARKRALRTPGHASVLRLIRGYRLHKVSLEGNEAEGAQTEDGA